MPEPLSEESLTPELFNFLWNSSHVHGDTRKDSEEWYNEAKRLILQERQAWGEERALIERRHDVG